MTADDPALAQSASRLITVGQLQMQFEPATGLIRHLRWGDTELLRGVYVAVRDQTWNTVTPRISELQITQTDDDADIRFVADCQSDPIDFRWAGHIHLSALGAVSYSFRGRANSTFLRNRIGFCVLHPPECAGRVCQVDHVDGSRSEFVLPTNISPHQPIMNMRAIQHAAAPGVEVAVEFRGDTFEMEDQRNWTDASFKTYCTPLCDPFPVAIQAGDVVEQEVAIRATTAAPSSAGDSTSKSALPRRVVFSRDSGTSRALPEIGLQSVAGPLVDADAQVLRRVGVDHLRIDLLDGTNLAYDLESAALQATSIDARIELALFVGDADQSLDVLEEFSELIRRVLVFDKRGGTPKGDAASDIQSRLRRLLPHTQIGSGTNRYFAELNRARPDSADWDVVTWSINPQVHAFDDLSLVETLEMQAVTVNSARSFLDDAQIVVSPITLRPRFNPDASVFAADQIRATDQSRQADRDATDQRQATLFAAGWTLGSLKYLAEAGASSVTYYELLGPRGIMRSTTNVGTPEGEVFPVYHLLADLLGYRGGTVRVIHSSDSLTASAIILERAGKERVIVANHTPETVTVAVPLQGDHWRMRYLDETTVRQAATNPESFRETWATLKHHDGRVEYTLLPHAIMTLDHAGEVDV